MKYSTFCTAVLLCFMSLFANERRPNSVGLQFSSFSGLSAAYRHYFPKRFGVEFHGWNSEKREIRQYATGLGGMLLFRIDQSAVQSRNRRMLYAFFLLDSEYHKGIVEEYYTIYPNDYASDMGTRDRIDSRLVLDYGPGLGFNIGRAVVLSINVSYGFNRVTLYDNQGFFKGDSGFRVMLGTMYDFSFRSIGKKIRDVADSQPNEGNMI